MRTFVLCTFFIVLGAGSGRGEDAECKQKTSHLAPVRLKKDLLCDYDKTARPLLNHMNATKVTIKMLLKYFTYESYSNSLSVHNWMTLHWKDEHLKWDPSKYESISRIHLSSDEIWVPDFSLYNRDDQSGSAGAITSVTCLVTSTGTVVCVPPGRHSALCMADLTKYPYDKQSCTLRFGSWVHSGEEVDFLLNSPAVVKGEFTPNGDWKLVTVEAKRYPGHFNCCPDSSYPSVAYNFVIERHSATHAATIIVPALVMIMMTLTTLWMNPEQLDRMCLACCSLIVHFLYLQGITWSIPSRGDNPPLLVIFGRDSLLLSAFSVVLTVMLKTIVGSSSSSSPTWISSVVSVILSNRPGQLLLLYDTSLKGVATARGEEDGADIIKDAPVPSASKSSDWHLFAKLLDRLSFIAFSITYVCIFMAFIV